MTQEINNYPNIKKAALAIAYDNGIIFRDQTEEQWLIRVNSVITADGVYHDDLIKWDEFLGSVSPEAFEIITNGEHSEQLALMKLAPRPQNETEYDENGGVNGLLNDIFEAE